MKNNNRFIYKTASGRWADKRVGASRPSKLFDTQKEAVESGHQKIEKSGGGELTIAGEDHLIRRKITIAPGNDPCPPKDRT